MGGRSSFWTLLSGLRPSVGDIRTPLIPSAGAMYALTIHRESRTQNIPTSGLKSRRKFRTRAILNPAFQTKPMKCLAYLPPGVSACHYPNFSTCAIRNSRSANRPTPYGECKSQAFARSRRSRDRRPYGAGWAGATQKLRFCTPHRISNGTGGNFF